MNKAILVGNLTRDPELRMTGGNVPVCSFTIAVNRPFANAQGEREADFIPVVVWRSQAESCAKYLKKGSKVSVCGSIRTRTYDDKEGNKRYITEVVADEVQFIILQTGEGSHNHAPHAQHVPSTPAMPVHQDIGQPIQDDELPF